MKTQNIIAVSLLLLTFGAQAQIITTIAGSDTGGYAGDGAAATLAQLNTPNGVAVDVTGNVYIADQNNARIRKVAPSGIITTFAGNGIGLSSGDGNPATDAEIGSPIGVAVDGAANVYVVDVANHVVRKINSSGIISTIAGTGTAGYNGDGIAATAAELNYPSNVALDGSGNVYIADASNHRIRKISATGIISTFAGGGSSGLGDGGAATMAQLSVPYGIAIDGSDNVYLSDVGDARIRKIDVSGNITTIGGNGTSGYSGDGTAATSAQISPGGIGINEAGDIFLANGNSRIRKIDASGIISTIAGTGIWGFSGDGGAATAARLADPSGVAVDNGGSIYVGDVSNNRIRKVTNNSTEIKTSTNVIASINVFPNPINEKFAIVISSVTIEPVQITITNTAGEVVEEITATTNSLVDIQLNQPDGIYFISAASAHEKWLEKIVK